MSKGFIIEKLVKLKQEISIIITRFANNKYEIYEPIENKHEDQILKFSKIPAEINKKIYRSIERLGNEYCRGIKICGYLMCRIFH